MSIRNLTIEQLSSVPCPTCGVGPRELCVLHSGGSRSDPHLDRKFAAVEVIKTKRLRARKAHSDPDPLG